jgi:integrase
MSADLLSRDNPLLSRPKTNAVSSCDNTHTVNCKGGPDLGGAGGKCINCTPLDMPTHTDAGECINCTTTVPLERVADYVRQSLADNTRRAYLSDLAHFEQWGGSVPASGDTVASYLAAHAETLKVATLVRRLASISKAHMARGLEDPARSELVKATLRGIKRTRRVGQHEAKPLMKEDLFLILAAMGDTLKDARDRALLLIGFAGGFRRSELVAIDRGDMEYVRQGLIVHVRRSKTDQEGRGRKIGIPHGRTRWCPVTALDEWLARSAIVEGPVFRPINRHGKIGSGRLSGEAVSLVVKERRAGASLDPARFSGHSLRAGLATSAAQAGVSTFKIRAQTGHTSDAMLARYIRDADIFEGNAVSSIL